jgi:chitooligosaccharide deacetylase
VTRIALTFDDGPADWTEPIADLLAEHGVPATFFVIGSAAVERPDVLRRLVADGHEVGNHSWSHPSLRDDCDDARVRDELARTSAAIEEILGAPPRLYRAPRYHVDERVDGVARSLGLTHVRGDVIPADWLEGWRAALTVTLVLNGLRPEAIVGLHDGVPAAEQTGTVSRQGTVDAVAQLLPRLREREVQIVPAAELVGALSSGR